MRFLTALIAAILLLSNLVFPTAQAAQTPIPFALINSPEASNAIDPDLEPGFPTQTLQTPGTYWGGASINTLVVNVDDDPKKEIFATSISTGPLNGWNSCGTPLPGWPVMASYGAIYPSAGNLLADTPGLQVVSQAFAGQLGAYDDRGDPLPGWPLEYGGTWVAPILVDINGDHVDEIVVSELYRLTILAADGTVLPGWPVDIHPKIAGVAVADLEKDGEYDIITFTEPMNGYTCMEIFSEMGTSRGYCSATMEADVRMHPVIGDVDGDGENEIVVNAAQSVTVIMDYTGLLEHQVEISNYNFSSAPALADLNGDSIPEIVVQTMKDLYVFNGDGTALPGWPQTLQFPSPANGVMNGAPVIGDVDGDHLPEIVIAGNGLSVYNHDGSLLVHKDISGSLQSPAIADMDLDGRNEIICASSYWDGFTQFANSIWAFDLGNGPHGSIEWGQYGGGPQHQGVYPVPRNIDLGPAPLPGVEPKSFFPFISRPESTPQETRPNEIRGWFNDDGIPIAGLVVELVSFDGAYSTPIGNTITNADGMYQFTDIAPITANQEYYVVVNLSGNNSGLVGLWSSRPIFSLKTSGLIDLGPANLADVVLLTPPDGYVGDLPVQLTWELRQTDSFEYYAVELFDPSDYNPALLDIPYMANNGLTISSLPYDFSFNQPIGWAVWVFGSDRSYGVSNQARRFSVSGSIVPSGLPFETEEWMPNPFRKR